MPGLPVMGREKTSRSVLAVLVMKIRIFEIDTKVNVGRHYPWNYIMLLVFIISSSFIYILLCELEIWGFVFIFFIRGGGFEMEANLYGQRHYIVWYCKNCLILSIRRAEENSRHIDYLFWRLNHILNLLQESNREYFLKIEQKRFFG